MSLPGAPRTLSLHRLTSCALAALAIGAWSAPGAAQTARGFALNRFEPSETGSEWFALDTLDLRGGARPALGVVGDYGYKPYIVENADGSENTAIISDQLFSHLGASLVLFDRVRLGVTLPVALTQHGSDTEGTVNGERIVIDRAAGIGDVRAAIDVRLVGEYGDPFTLALGGRIWLPTGDASKFLGDERVRVGPHLAAAGDVGALAYAATLGVLYRANSEPFVGHPTGTEVNYGMALGLRAVEKKLLIGPELFGTSVVSDSGAFLGARTTPLALLGSLHYTAGDVRFGAGAGPGLSHAAGTAAFRALASIEYVPGPSASSPPDRDADEIVDDQDACPDIKGVRTEDPKTNGCPADRDADGATDSVDACPDTAGVKTDDPKTNGCPATHDSDADGILDDVDACPQVAGVKTDDPKTNGCPPDGDKDSIADSVDACPTVPGEANQDPKKNGCPAMIVENQIQITEQIKFRTGKAILDPVSSPALDTLLKIVLAHPEVPKIRVEGHTDNTGGDTMNKRLSENRAAAVANWLNKHGVPRQKLTVVGHGPDKPIDTNDTDEGRANNRRVEFHVEGEGDPKP